MSTSMKKKPSEQIKHYSDASEVKETLRIFTDPKLQESIEKDPVFEIVQQYWRPLLIVLVLVGAFIYGKGLYKDAVKVGAEKSAEAYNKVQLSFNEVEKMNLKLIEDKSKLEEIVGKNPEKKAEEEKKIADTENELKSAKERFSDAVKVLADGDEPYKSIGVLYNSSSNEGQVAAPLEDWKSTPEASAAKRLFTEIAALKYARGLLAGDEASRDKGFTELKRLATDSSYVKIVAAIALSKVAEKPEEKTDAFTILEQIKTTSPEQDELIKSELK